jgi:hypothetical protein
MMTSIEEPNLISHRTAHSVWDKRGWRGSTVEERLAPWLVSLGGAGLFAFGASRRSWRGVPYMAAGAALIGCVAAGLCDPREIGHQVRHRMRQASEPDQVTIEAMDSFPASDAPSSNATTAAPTVPRDR